MVVGEITDEALQVAASLCARYSDAKKLSEVEVTVIKEGAMLKLRTAPYADEMIETLRIELKSAKHKITIPNSSKAIA